MSAAPLAPPVPVPAPDIIPLLPRGDTVFEDLPVRALVLEALAPAIGDGLIVIRRSPGVGVILIRSGRVTDTYAVEVVDFIACLREARLPLNTEVEGIKVLEVILGAYASAERREIVELRNL